MNSAHTEAAMLVRARIREVIASRGGELVAAYYRDPAFAGDLFDGFGLNDPDRFTADDIVAASLLDVRFGPAAVRALLGSSGTNPDLAGANEQLSLIPTDVSLGQIGAAEYDAILGEDSPAWVLWNHLRTVAGMGPTRVSKLLARKRPALMPIIDSVVIDRLALPVGAQWATLNEALRDADLRREIDDLGDMAVFAGQPRPTTLRLLDVATWMNHSESDNARRVRTNLGIAVKDR